MSDIQQLILLLCLAPFAYIIGYVGMTLWLERHDHG